VVKTSFLTLARRNDHLSRASPVRVTGRYVPTTVAGETVHAFVPHDLPPKRPALMLDGRLTERNRAAEQALRRLDLAGQMVPSLDGFFHAFVRKEAVVSSQIEGTQASLVDLLAYEADETPEAEAADVEEVCNYVDALVYASAELQKPKGLPLSMRLLNGAHERLMRGSRGSNKRPGEIRKSQNWIGGSRPGNAAFVPPPPGALSDALSAF
jgi:Fic family protein